MNKPGFLYFFTEQELSKILNTTLTVAKNTVTDGGGSETVTDKVFLLSNTEVGLANENGIAEGNQLLLFNNASNRVTCLTQQAFDNTKSSSKPSEIGDAWQWWLRTPFSSNSNNARLVNSSDALNRDYVYYGNTGICPALNLSPEIFVSDGIGYDGCYSVADKYIITLDKPITVATTDYLMQYKFNPKINNTDMTIKKADAEKNL